MLGLGNTLTASNPIESLIDPGTWILYIFDDSPDTTHVRVAGYIASTATTNATDYLTNTPITAGNRINLTNGDPLSVSVTFNRVSSSNATTVEATTTGTAYLYRATTAENPAQATFWLSPLNNTSQSLLDLAGLDGSGQFDLTTFGDNSGVTPSVPGGQTSVSNIYRVSITVSQSPPFASSATIAMTNAVFLTTVS
tara:strand:- start:3271 stop:3858 length:588 start_codon:yes stop_codon:yes gene_type:complete